MNGESSFKKIVDYSILRRNETTFTGLDMYLFCVLKGIFPSTRQIRLVYKICWSPFWRSILIFILIHYLRFHEKFMKHSCHKNRKNKDIQFVCFHKVFWREIKLNITKIRSVISILLCGQKMVSVDFCSCDEIENMVSILVLPSFTVKQFPNFHNQLTCTCKNKSYNNKKVTWRVRSKNN